MRVGTDGVLLGAWAAVEGARRVLDVGCGSGLIALMAAQRNASAYVTGVEIDPSAAADAQANAAASPFAKRVRIVCKDVLQMAARPGGDENVGEKKLTTPATCAAKDRASSFFLPPYDCILANPPYHEEDLLPPSARRATARHTAGGGLTFAALLRAADALLAREPLGEMGEKTKRGEEEEKGGDEGVAPPAEPFVPQLSLILPTQALSHFLPLAAVHGFYVSRQTTVVTRPNKASKRTLLTLTRKSQEPVRDTLTLLAPDGTRSVEYAELCREFYLDKKEGEKKEKR